MADALAILADVLRRYDDNPKWTGAPFEHIRRVPNTKVGDVGQDFVEKPCEQIGFEVGFPEDTKGKRKRQNPWDMMIEGKTFEVKTASEDKSGPFQFNHIRYHRPYEAVLCIGIGPSGIFRGRMDQSGHCDRRRGQSGIDGGGSERLLQTEQAPGSTPPDSGVRRGYPGLARGARCIVMYISPDDVIQGFPPDYGLAAFCGVSW